MAEHAPPDNKSGAGAENQPHFPFVTDLASLSQRFSGPLPVLSWNPPFRGDIDMKIARDGAWFYQGSLIERPALVRFFSRLLRKDGERYVLVTPVECAGIQVEDVPFIASGLEVIEGASVQTLKFHTNVGDEVILDAAHPLRFETGAADGITPYLLVRDGLWARLTRALTLELIGCGSTQERDGQSMFGIASAGAFFAIAPADEFE
jgi:hypothetical protein